MQIVENKPVNRNKKNRLICLVAILLIISIRFVFIPFIAGLTNSDLILFNNNEVKAVLVIRDPADLTETDYKYITDSAGLIRKHFKDATGQELPQFTELEYRSSPEAEGFAGKIKIHLGWDGLNPHPDLAQTLIDLNAEADNDGNHGYVFAPYADNVVVQSPTPLGVRYGAAAFLRKYLDVEWLMPGPYGADTPTMETIIIPRVLISSAPVFNMRYAWDERTPVDWLLNHGLQLYPHTKMGNFSHALSFYFDPDKYYGEHPEYYPIRDGEHYRPTDEIAWQPRFSEPGTVDVAANEIISLLKDEPNLVTVSLGVNDSGGYCEQELAEQEAIHGLNSEGLVHMTDLYCKWSNAVIEKVLAEFPGRNIKFGMIAYRNLNDPPKEPGLKFHESMIPYITKDRSAWVDPEQEAQGHQITQDWLERSSQLGWYNYEYGSVYLVPRIYNTKMQEYLQFAQAQGLKYLFSEALFSIDEGPKPHVFAMLNWNPQYSQQELEDRWYRKAVGAKAAPHLAAFYDVWEEIWTEDIPKSKWFEKCKNFTYLWFNSFDYLDDIPFQKVLIARQHLDRAWEEVQNNGNEEQLKRLEAIRQYYDLEEATVFALMHSYHDLSQADAMEILKDGFLDQQYQIRDIAISRYTTLLDETDPLFNRPTAYFEEALSDPSLNPEPLWAIVDYIQRHEPNGGPVFDRVLELAGALSPTYERQFCRLIVSCLQANNLITDPSFEEGSFGKVGHVEEVWVPWVEDPGTLARVDNPAFIRTGSMSLKAENHWNYGSLSQVIPVKPGLLTVRSHYYTLPESRPYGALLLVIQPMDLAGNVLEGNYAMSKIYDLSISSGEWLSAEILFDVPEVIEGKNVEFVYVQLVLEEQNDVPLYLDDIEAYQAPETGMLDALMAEILLLGIERPSSSFYTMESWNQLKTVFDAVETRLGKGYFEIPQISIDRMYSDLQRAKDGLVARPLELIETKLPESVATGDPSRLVYHPEDIGAATALEAEFACVEPAQAHD